MKPHCLAALLLTLWFPGGAFGWSGYLRLDGVKGEAQEENHAGWMDISAADAADLANTNAATGGGHVEQGVFYFAKNLDHASPALQLACAQGKPIPFGALDLIGTNSPLPFFRLNLTNVFVTQVGAAGQAGDADRPQETIGLVAQITAWHYTQFNAGNGLPNYINSQWDFGNNTGTGGAQPPAFLMSGIRLADGVQLNWQATAGKRYGIYAVTQLGQPFTLVAVVTATATGDMTSTQPMNGNAMFFIVQELPE
ncbi:MAG: type VI secretion system tube protein Hcp [Verrucomicrobiota bacterium]